jgi:hypothetical protein
VLLVETLTVTQPIPFTSMEYDVCYRERFETPAAALIKTKVLWDPTPFKAVNRYRRFGEACCYHLQISSLDCG